VTLLTVERSSWRQFLVGLVGLILIVTAFDVLWGHWVSTPPHTDDQGVITTKGEAQRRADIIWGGALLVGGGALLGGAVVGLVRRRPVLIVEEKGLDLYITGPTTSAYLSWADVRSVRSSAADDPDGGRSIRVLRVEVTERGELPADPWGAEWDGDTLTIDATGWSVPLEEVVVHADLALVDYRREADTAPGDDEYG